MLISFFLLFFSFYFFFDILFLSVLPFFLTFFCLYMHGVYFDGLFFFDLISLFMVFSCIWVFWCSLMVLDMKKNFFLVTWVLFLFSVLAFSVGNFLLFYFVFEVLFSLMFFFLISWGISPERLEASFYMFFYTLVFSFPFLLLLFYSFLVFGGSFLLLGCFSYSGFLWGFMLMVFVVKLPLFGFHLWLPKAHVEAPLVGSMVLAGIFLKLGGYGLFRFIPLVDCISLSYSFFLSVIFYVSLLGGLIISVLCSRVMDLKMIIAYSSIVHMSLMFLGLFSFSLWGLLGSFYMMVAHGFISPVMFFLMTEIYSFYHSRSMMVLGGLLKVSSLFAFFWFFSCFLNLGIPPFMSFFSEFIIIGSMSFLSFVEWVFIALCCFFTGVYCVFMNTGISFGYTFFSSVYFFSVKSMLLMVCMMIFVLFFPLVFFII